MKDLARKGLFLGLGLLVMTREQVEKAVDELAKKGKISAEESKKLIHKLIETGEKEREQMDKALRERINKILAELNVPTRKDLEALEERIRRLEEEEIRKELKALEERVQRLKEETTRTEPENLEESGRPENQQ